MSSIWDDGLNLSHQQHPRSASLLMVNSPHNFPHQAPSLHEEGSRYSNLAHEKNSGRVVCTPVEMGLRSMESLGYYAAASTHAANQLQRDITRLSSTTTRTGNNTTSMMPLRSLMELENEITGLEEMYVAFAKERDESVLTTLQHMGAFLPPRPTNTAITPTTKKYRRSKHGLRNGGEGDIALSAAYARSLKLSAEFGNVVSHRQEEAAGREEGAVSGSRGGPIQDTLEALLRSDEKSLEQTSQRIQEEADIQHSLLAALDRLVQAKIKQVSTGFDFEQRCGNPFEEPLVTTAQPLKGGAQYHNRPYPTQALASTRSKVVEGNSRGDSNGNLHSTDADLHARISKASAELAALKKRRAMVDEDNYRASGQLTQLLRKFHSKQEPSQSSTFCTF
jgi:hypothetical protein